MTVGRVVPVLNIIKDRSTNMYRVLITDDEKIEREGIKFLLAQDNIINLRKKWKGICSQVPFIVLKYRQGCI